MAYGKKRFAAVRRFARTHGQKNTLSVISYTLHALRKLVNWCVFNKNIYIYIYIYIYI